MGKKEKKDKKKDKKDKKEKKSKDKKDKKKSKDKKEKKSKDKKEKKSKTETPPEDAPQQQQPQNAAPSQPKPQPLSSWIHSSDAEFNQPFPPQDFPTMLPASHPHSMLHHTINSQLIPKRHSLLNYRSKLKGKIFEIEAQKEQLLEETRQHYTAICERIENRGKSKIDRVRDELLRTEEDIRNVDRFVQRSTSAMHQSVPTQDSANAFMNAASFSSTNSMGTQTGLVSNSDYVAECKYLTSKPTERPIHLGEEFPREMQENSRIRQCYEELKRIVHVKDQIIEDLVAQREQSENRRISEVQELTRLYQNTKRELFNWIQVSDRLSGRNERFALEKKTGYSTDHTTQYQPIAPNQSIAASRQDITGGDTLLDQSLSSSYHHEAPSFHSPSRIRQTGGGLHL